MKMRKTLFSDLAREVGLELDLVEEEELVAGVDLVVEEEPVVAADLVEEEDLGVVLVVEEGLVVVQVVAMALEVEEVSEEDMELEVGLGKAGDLAVVVDLEKVVA
jgi:hypothetical protein